jgi:hypothetical protein
METLKEEFSDSLTNMYEAGWNSALEMAAFKLKDAFGKDTLSSITIYLKGLKK